MKMKEKKKSNEWKRAEELVRNVKAQKKCATVGLDVAIAYSWFIIFTSYWKPVWKKVIMQKGYVK